jgi:TPP-dependent pyruvate/acetoin dehydrogenase alpha subunit
MSRKELDALNAKIGEELEEAIQYASDSPFPTADQLLEDVYYVKGA